VSERLIEISKLSYTYPGRAEASLAEVDLSVGAGEFVLVSGPTGCGKSTLLRTLNGIIPHDSGGKVEGSVKVLGRDTREAGVVWLSSRVGLVFQGPEDQLFSSSVEDEVAFGLENLRVESGEIAGRVRWALEEVGLAPESDVPVAELSGGQKQRLAIASVVAMRPRVIALDEPLSQLDPAGAEQVLEVLVRLGRDLGIAVVLVEHRMDHVVPLADRVVLMERGRIVLDCPADRAFDDPGLYERLGLRLPEPLELMRKLGRKEKPRSAEEAVRVLREKRGQEPFVRSTLSGLQAKGSCPLFSEPVVELRNVSVRYSRRGPEVLTGLNLTVYRGETVAVMGPNGSGKSTLLYTILGELRPWSGWGRVLGEDVTRGRRRRLGAEVGMLLQNPDLMLLAERVEEEVSAGPVNLGLTRAEVERRTAQVMKALGLEGLSAEPPLALSRGQRLRVALASILSMTPGLLLLDEPTTGQDRYQIESMMDHLVGAREGDENPEDGKGDRSPNRKAPVPFSAVIFCTHDVRTAGRYADKVVVLAGGRVRVVGSAAEVFSDGEAMKEAHLHPPVALDIARGLGLEGVASVEELARRLCGAEGRTMKPEGPS
jgi:energy-coupling factor transport system ATP-binding protein